MNEKQQPAMMNAYQAMATYVRAFFEAYLTGVLDATCANVEAKERLKPKNVKQAMLEHYGHVGEAFFSQMFYIMAQLAYDDVDKAVERVRQECGADADIPQYMRAACADDNLYEAMIMEYRRNFEALLAGAMPSAEVHVVAYKHGDKLSKIDIQRAIRLLVRVVMRTYVQAQTTCQAGASHYSQVSVLRMLSQHLSLLVHDQVLDGDFETLDALLLHACGSEPAFAALCEEMNSMMTEMN